MTVSPRRAQDGQHQSSAANDSSQTNDYGPKELPPTLFKLRNLNPESPQHSESEQPEPMVGDEITEPDSRADSESPAARVLAADFEDHPPVSERTPPIDDADAATPEPEPEVPDVGNRGPFPAPPEVDSIPAGRTWTELFGSHALVLTMLLVVVAAAVLTGRNSGDPNELDDAAAASVGKEIRFDSLGQTELPMPEHLHLAKPAELPADHSPAKSAFESADPRAIEPFVSTEERSITERLALGDVSSDAIATVHSQPSASPSPAAARAVTASSSVTQVNGSEPNASAYGGSEAGPIAKAGPGVKTNHFFDGSTSAGGSRVSNRRAVMEDEALAVPTLEDLESSAGIIGDANGYDGPSFSRTPFGITDGDLLLHLDELIQQNSRSATTRKPAATYSATATGSPTSSN